MTPQVKRIIGVVLIVIGIHITNCRELHDSKYETSKKENHADDIVHNTTLRTESIESTEDLLPNKGSENKHSEKKQHKREQRTFVQIYPKINRPKPKHKTKQKNIETTYTKESRLFGPVFPVLTRPGQRSNPKPKPKIIEAPYPRKYYIINHTYNPITSQSTGEGNYNWKGFFNPNTTTYSPSMPFVASDIEIRRAVPFENDYINRRYASKIHFPKATLSPGIPNLSPQDLSASSNPPNPNNFINQDVGFIPQLPPEKVYQPLTQGLHPHNYQYLPSFFPPPSFLPNSDDNLNRLQNPFVTPHVEPTQSLAVPSYSLEYDNTRVVDSSGFVPWIPPGYEHLQQFSPLDRFAPGTFSSAQTPSTGFNVEVSEIGEPAFIVPENIGKVDITIPPPFAPLRTHGLSINDAQVTRNEVRKDNGEFLSSYTTFEGTERQDAGSLVPTADGDQVLVLRGSYSFTTPEGLRFRVDYTADETGYHATQVPISGGSGSS